MKKICFDLDGVICSNTYGEYDKAKPIPKAIQKINRLYEEGNEIIIFTARFMGRTGGDFKKSYEFGFDQAKSQIDSWGLKYHQLKFGKPEYDISVDDKGFGYSEKWIDEL